MISSTSNAELQKKVRENEIRLGCLQERAEIVRKSMAVTELYRGDDLAEATNCLEMLTVLDTIERDISAVNRKLRSDLMALCRLLSSPPQKLNL